MPLNHAQQGETVTYGRYPQTAAGTDRTPLEWLVLENTGRELLVLSKYLIDCSRYHHEFAATTWRDCDLRRRLNNEFYESAFSAAERKRIKTTLTADNGPRSPNTKDRVFLLSEAEVLRLTQQLGKDFLRARGTEFAKGKKPDGCRLYVMDKNVPADYLREGRKLYGCSWWWLRNQGRLQATGPDPSRVAFIGTRASVRHYARVDRSGNGVRPVMRLS
jgi:hypothetical protein